MTDNDREFLKEFVGILRGERKKTVWLPAVLDLGKIVAVVWGASQVVAEVKVLRRDVDAAIARVGTIETRFARHEQSSVEAVENIDGRLTILESREGLPTRPIPRFR
jgi:nucleoside diphosphate kinase